MSVVARVQLAHTLTLIAQHDTDYPIRYELVFRAIPLALAAGYPAGVALDPVEPDWPVVYIELPDGQVSWHMPAHPVEFDGHSTEEKYRRITAYTTLTLGGDQE